MEIHTAYIGLGSNIQAEKHLPAGVRGLLEMPGLQGHRLSPVYQTTAWGNTDQPDFLNAVMAVQTGLPPLELLDNLLELELGEGRERAEVWGPRTLDLDLLIYGNQAIDHPRLRVPHPLISEREFVLVPLLDLAPDLAHPLTGRPFATLLSWLPDQEGIRLAESDPCAGLEINRAQPTAR